jgi:ADP-ribose pyrophosphatase YjhB (NUDIX family)
MQVKVRALLWHGDLLIVARESHQGVPRLSIPGGRPRPHETLLYALEREVREETGLEIEVGRLLYVAECVSRYGLADTILIFGASPTTPVELERVELVDPDSAGAADVLPPVVDEVARDRPGPSAPRWLGNVWKPPPPAAG